MIEEEMKASFKKIKKTYSPRWDKNKEWQAEFAATDLCRGYSGYCDSKRKRVFLDSRDVRGMIPDAFLAFLIHEICHDVAAAGHNLTWARRMERAAKHAESIPEKEIAHHVRNQIFCECGSAILDQTVEKASLCEYWEWFHNR